MKSVITALLLALLSAGSQAVEIAGTPIDETARVFGKELSLNGAGVRTAMLIKVYVAALYLQQKSKDADEVIESRQSKRLLMVFKRNLKSNIVGAAFRDGIRPDHRGPAGAVFDQHQKHVPSLFFERDDLARAQQQAVRDIQAEWAKFIEMVVRLGHTPNSETIQKSLSKKRAQIQPVFRTSHEGDGLRSRPNQTPH